jgi:hypothetical protein
MDFSSNVDPSLQSPFSPSSTSSHSSDSASLDYMASYDFDLLSEGLDLYPSMVCQTIEPSQLTDSSPYSPPYSPAPSSALVTPSCSPSPHPRSPNYPSDAISEPSAPRPRRSMNKQHKAEKQQVATGFDHGHSPYDKEHGHHVKRHQTKLACTWCRKLSKKCDAQRPCGRCVQFDRCSECVDAAPRKPRAKGVDRGTYKKTRDLAAVNDEEAVAKREAYVAKQERLGRSVKVGLSADEILEKIRKDDVRMEKELQREGGKVVLPPNVDLGELLPFTGPLEDLFTCSASPEIEELLFSSPSSSSEDSLFDVSSPTDSNSVAEVDESDLDSFQWRSWDLFPELVNVGSMAQVPDEHAMTAINLDHIQAWSAIVA